MWIRGGRCGRGKSLWIRKRRKKRWRGMKRNRRQIRRLKRKRRESGVKETDLDTIESGDLFRE